MYLKSAPSSNRCVAKLCLSICGVTLFFILALSRVSTDEQAKTGYSLDIQEETILEYCLKNNIQVVKKFREDHSAKNFNRPEFKNYLEFAKKNKNKIDYLLVTTWDRFSRNTTDSYEMIRRLKGYGVEVQAVQQPLDLSIPESKVLLAIYLTMPHVDNERRGMKVKEGMRAAIKAGRWTGKAPRGYLNSRDESNKPLIIKSEEAHHILYAFTEFSKGMKTQIEIIDELSRKGVCIRKNTFSRILRNILYISKLRVRALDNEPEYFVNGKHEPIVRSEVFFRVQELLTKNQVESKHPQFHTKREELPLRGFLLCNSCNGKMTGSASRGRNGKRHFYYHCNTCKKTRHRAALVNDSMEKMLSKISLSSEVEELYLLITKLIFEDGEKSLKKEKELSTKKQVELNTKLDRLDNLLLGGNLEIEDYNQMKSRLKNELGKLKSRKTEIKLNRSEFEKYISSGLGLLKNLESSYSS